MPDELNPLTAVSPIDGRYHSKTKDLTYYFSEAALMKYRVKIESKYLCALSDFKVIRRLNLSEEELLGNLPDNFSLEDAKQIKEEEKVTNHDVKAVEYFMRKKLKGTSLNDVAGMLHFGLTSYDINDNAAYMMLRDGINKVYRPSLVKLEEKILSLAEEYKQMPMLGRTHGQPASPTTLGKEFSVFGRRLAYELENLVNARYSGKLNGAVGNYNALQAAFPNIDWIQFSKKFLESLGLSPNLITTQIEPHDALVGIFHNMIRINNIILGLDQDVWRYISDDYLLQKPKEGEIGSSTMPHKINPIDFENSEGNIIAANGLLSAFASKLQVSRLQRDLSDSTITRNIGSAVAYCLLASDSAFKGLGKIYANKELMLKELQGHIEILAEPIQTILRKENVPEAYEKLKELTRGKEVSTNDIALFIDDIGVSQEAKQRLRALKPENYIGLAVELTELAIKDSRSILSHIGQPKK
ncbi:adenylosuccinate lyase [Candidatus Woesearchaeota archaeon]|nr:adenylosuccinate lyase [Candidatus Woesearchaeota archaeon]